MSAAASVADGVDHRFSTESRIAALDWTELAAQLDAQGCALAPGLLTARQCRSLAVLYAEQHHFRSRVVMERHGYGRGEYKYFSYPLPALVAGLRKRLYPHLAEVANRWNELLRLDVRYPPEHAAFLQRCHQAGQSRPTPLLLQYGEGDYNCLHQDL